MIVSDPVGDSSELFDNLVIDSQLITHLVHTLKMINTEQEPDEKSINEEKYGKLDLDLIEGIKTNIVTITTKIIANIYSFSQTMKKDETQFLEVLNSCEQSLTMAD